MSTRRPLEIQDLSVPCALWEEMLAASGQANLQSTQSPQPPFPAQIQGRGQIHIQVSLRPIPQSAPPIQ